MKLDNQFTIDAAPDDVWSTMLDLERVAACVPGSEVIGATDDGGLEANIRVKVGPMTMSYRGVVTIVERDHGNRRAVMKSKARETKGQGSATAEMVMEVRETQPVEVSLMTNLEVTGRVAQMGRGIMQDVAGRLITEFAEALRAMIGRQSGTIDAAAGGDLAPQPPGSQSSGTGPRLSALRIGSDASVAAGGIAAGQLAAPIGGGAVIATIVRGRLSALVALLRGMFGNGR